MIQIAICDDDMTTTSQIEEYIRQIEIEQHIQVQYRIFFDGKSFIQSVTYEPSAESFMFFCAPVALSASSSFCVM